MSFRVKTYNYLSEAADFSFSPLPTHLNSYKLLLIIIKIYNYTVETFTCLCFAQS